MGARVGDDLLGCAGLLAALPGDRHRRAPDRDAQFVRPSAVVEPTLDHPARSKFPDTGAVRRLCGLSADPLGGSDGGRLWVGTNLQLDARRETNLSFAIGRRADRSVRCPARVECLWRSQPLGRTEVRAFYGALILERHEAAALAFIPADDTGSGDDFPVGRRCRYAALVATGLDPRQGAVVLFSPAPNVDP